MAEVSPQVASQARRLRHLCPVDRSLLNVDAPAARKLDPWIPSQPIAGWKHNPAQAQVWRRRCTRVVGALTPDTELGSSSCLPLPLRE